MIKVAATFVSVRQVGSSCLKCLWSGFLYLLITVSPLKIAKESFSTGDVFILERKKHSICGHLRSLTVENLFYEIIPTLLLKASKYQGLILIIQFLILPIESLLIQTILCNFFFFQNEESLNIAPNFNDWAALWPKHYHFKTITFYKILKISFWERKLWSSP